MINEIISDDPRIQRHYEKCLKEGTSPKLAEMFALGQGPSLRTDATFMRDNANGKQFADNPQMGDHYKKIAERHGVSVTGKKYMHGLAKFQGDPMAWVDSRHDVQRVCEERGWECEGAVNVKMRQLDNPIAPKDVADDLVNEEVGMMIEDTPELLNMKPELLNKKIPELREQVRDKRKPDRKRK